MPFYLYKASAGSGKTYTLVMEYLKLLFQNAGRLKHILAVTFTNKAAGEMKGRVVKALKSLSSGEATLLFLDLKKALPGISIEEKAAEILQNILHHYSDFHIMTIDSFTYRIIQSFALELGLPPNFNIDLKPENIISKAIDRMFGRVGIDKPVTDILLKFIFSRLNESQGWKIESDILKTAIDFYKEQNYILFNELSNTGSENIVKFIIEIENYITNFHNTMYEKGKKALDLITGAGLKKSDLAYCGEGNYSYFEKIMRRSRCDDFRPGSRIRECKWFSRDAPQEIKETMSSVLESGLNKITDDIYGYLDAENNFIKYTTVSAIFKNIHTLALLEIINEYFEDYKRKNGIMPISDFNRKIAGLMDKESIPFIFVMAGETYTNFLLDEFQDTSRLQWRNIYPLIENSLASGFLNMAVGDGKQAIYRWRNGDAEIMEKDIPGTIPPDKLETRSLSCNYRSSAGIVDFNNRFFKAAASILSENDSVSCKIYDSPEQQAAGEKGKGFVQVEFIQENEEYSYPAALAEKIAGIAESLKNYGYSYGDIAVLVRRNSEGAEMAELLLQAGIPVISPDSLLIGRAAVVRFTVSAMAFLLSTDKASQKAGLFFQYINLLDTGEDDKAMLREIAGKALINKEKIMDNGNPLFIIESFIEKAGFFSVLPLYDLTEEIIRHFSLNKLSGGGNNGYIIQFLSVISGYSSGENGGIPDFLEWWEENGNTIAVSMNDEGNAVRIMTIHKSKGLEFPVVIIPFAGWDFKINNELYWLKPETMVSEKSGFDLTFPVTSSKKLMESGFKNPYLNEKEKIITDNLNLLYVSFTRAADELYVFSQQHTEKKKTEEIKNSAEIIRTALFNGFRHDIAAKPYTNGEHSVKRPGKPADTLVEETGGLISNSWVKKVTIMKRSKDMFKIDKNTEKADWGNLFHKMLSEITDIEQIPRVIEKYCKSGELPPEMKEKAGAKFTAVFTIPEVREWMSGKYKIKSEATVISPSEIIRPDRIFTAGGSVIILDYKTGKKEASHAVQLQKYAGIISKIENYDIKAYLLYTEKPELIRVNLGEELWLF